MYSMVLMAALTTSGEAPDHWMRSHGCSGCTGCYSSCHGCSGCTGWGCTGCYGSSHGCHGCSGCYGSSYGCGGCYGSSYGCTGCYSSGHGCSGSCYGGCYGGGYGATYGGCYGTSCYGAYYGGCYGLGTSWSAPVGGVLVPSTVGPVETVPVPKKDKSSVDLNRAKLVVELPADAKLFIDEQLMKTTSDKRSFNTPTLEKGQTYYYMVRAELMRDGKPVTETKRVMVRAGEIVRADFGSMDSVTTAKSR